jgi:phosphoglycerate kinase
MKNYYEETRDFWLINLSKQVESPTLMRIDINVPVVNGSIVETSYRLNIYADVLTLISEYTGIVALAHQGRRGQKDFIPLKQHWITLRKLLPSYIDIEYIPFDKIFTRETKEKIKNLEKGKILLLDNIRMMDEETQFNPETSRFINFFKGSVKTAVNDAIPVWHRAHTSLMALPYIAKTYIGVRSILELKTLDDVLKARGGEVALIMGGSKLAKVNYLGNILRWAEGYTGGLPGQLLAYADGHDLNEVNNRFLLKKFGEKDIEAARLLIKKFNVRYPRDFIVIENGEKKEVSIEEISRTRGVIYDIGPETVEWYADEVEGNEIRIRAGPLGVFERGFDNGVKLTKMIAGSGLIFLGGDTTAEIAMYHLDKIITSTGGILCVSGGSFLHGMAGEPYPSIDIILEKQIK